LSGDYYLGIESDLQIMTDLHCDTMSTE